MLEQRRRHIPLTVAMVSLCAVLATPAPAENMDPEADQSQYAWAENVGWINLEPGGDGGSGVHVDDFELTGWMWGENVGWISLSCKNRGTCDTVYYGVRNDGLGNLDGVAWGENVGWVRFSHPEGSVWIDVVEGVFYGHAWAENVGWIRMTSASGPAPYRIVTAWNCSPGPPPPAGTPDLTLTETGTETRLEWTAVTAASGYDVVYGDLDILRAPSGGDFVSSTLGCIAENETGRGIVHTESPTAGTGFWYLVRGVNCGAPGTYDSAGASQVAPRDNDIETSGINCVVP